MFDTNIKLVKENRLKVVHKLSGIHDTFVTTRCGIRINIKASLRYEGKEESVTCKECK